MLRRLAFGNFTLCYWFMFKGFSRWWPILVSSGEVPPLRPSSPIIRLKGQWELQPLHCSTCPYLQTWLWPLFQPSPLTHMGWAAVLGRAAYMCLHTAASSASTYLCWLMAYPMPPIWWLHRTDRDHCFLASYCYKSFVLYHKKQCGCCPASLPKRFISFLP